MLKLECETGRQRHKGGRDRRRSSVSSYPIVNVPAEVRGPRSGCKLSFGWGGSRGAPAPLAGVSKGAAPPLQFHGSIQVRAAPAKKEWANFSL